MAARVDLLQFQEDGHRYTLRGEPMQSVTQILDAAGIGDLSFVPLEVRDAARARGQAVHQAVQDLLQGTLDFAEISAHVVPYIRAFERFMVDAKFEPLLSEALVLSEKHGYCGRLDLFGPLQRVQTLIDVKSGSAGPGAGPQTAGYNLALQESYDLHATRRFALVLNPGKYELVPLQDQNDLRVFLAAVTVAHYQQRK